MFFERTGVFNNVYKLLINHDSVTILAPFTKIQTLSVPTQYLLLQTLPEHPKSFSSPYEKFYHPCWTLFISSFNFLNYDQFFSCHSVLSKPRYSHPYCITLFARPNPRHGLLFPFIRGVKPPRYLKK